MSRNGARTELRFQLPSTVDSDGNRQQQATARLFLARSAATGNALPPIADLPSHPHFRAFN